jgi:hypothetical protein
MLEEVYTKEDNPFIPRGIAKMHQISKETYKTMPGAVYSMRRQQDTVDDFLEASNWKQKAHT